MILNVPFIWKQLNGPQITGITKAIFMFIRNMFEDILSYFNYFSRRQCTIEHAEVIGMFNRFSRPALEEYNKNYFFFTRYLEHDNLMGFSELIGGRPGSIGGVFSSISDTTKSPERLDPSTYRYLLNAFLDNDAEVSSLDSLDAICHELVVLDAKDPSTFEYTFAWGETGTGADVLTIDVGNESDWNNPERILAVLRALGETLYLPNVIFDVAMTT